MHKKSLWIIGLVCCVTFGPSLGNGFVGDDRSFILENTFYEQWRNVRFLISPEYITDSDDIFNRNQNAVLTGSVAYRPLLSLTYFVDHGIWGKNPFGYHLTNVFLHLFNSVLAYFCLFYMFAYCFEIKKFSPQRVAFWGAIIFCVHPLKVEPVCSIGYRADLLATFFVFISFWLYLKTFKNMSGKGKISLFLSYFFFLCALFSKESVLVYPFLLMALEWSSNQGRVVTPRISLFKKISGYFLGVFLYVFLYIFVLPNSSLKHVGYLGGTFINHIILMIYFLYQYLLSILFPFWVRILPPVFLPEVNNILGIEMALAFISVILVLCISLFMIKQRNGISFLILWVLLSFLPIMNIIPIATPFAYRFLYFPSLGFSALIALLFFEVEYRYKKTSRNQQAGSIIRVGYAALCITISFFSVFSWKNDFVAAQSMVEDFPHSPGGYLMLSIQYQHLGLRQEAEEAALKSLELGIKDPRVYHVLGFCYANELDKAKIQFTKCVLSFPRYAPCFAGLGRISFLEKDYERAIMYFNRSQELSPSFSVYVSLLRLYLIKGEKDKAEKTYEEAKRNFPSKEARGFLAAVYEMKERRFEKNQSDRDAQD